MIPEINFPPPSLETGENDPCLRTRQAVAAVIQELKGVRQDGGLRIRGGELPWLDRLQGEAESLPEDENKLAAEMFTSHLAGNFLPDRYGLIK